MMRYAWIGTIVAGLVVVGCATPRGALRTEGEVQQIAMTLKDDRASEDHLGYGNCQWLYPFDAPQEKLIAQPKYGSVKPVFYAAKYGDSKDNIFTIALDESKGGGTGFDTFYVDVNNDNRLDAKVERFRMHPSGLTSREKRPVRVTFQVQSGGMTFPYSFDLVAFMYSNENNPEKKMHATARDSSYRVGEVVIDGKPCRIVLADLNSNGLFNDPEKSLFEGDRFFVDVSGDSKFEDAYPQWNESFPYGGYTRIGETWYAFTASPDGGTARFARAKPPIGWVECAAPGCTVELRSEAQALQLTFNGARQEAVAGTYRPKEICLTNDNSRLGGTFPDTVPEIVITEGGVTKLTAGTPLEIVVEPSPGEEAGCIALNLAITGTGGEQYRGVPEASFEVHDNAGATVAQAKFEYG